MGDFARRSCRIARAPATRAANPALAARESEANSGAGGVFPARADTPPVQDHTVEFVGVKLPEVRVEHLWFIEFRNKRKARSSGSSFDDGGSVLYARGFARGIRRHLTPRRAVAPG